MIDPMNSYHIVQAAGAVLSLALVIGGAVIAFMAIKSLLKGERGDVAMKGLLTAILPVLLTLLTLWAVI